MTMAAKDETAVSIAGKKAVSLAEERWMNYYYSVVEEGREVMYHVTKSLYKGGNADPLTYCKNHFKGGEEMYYSRFKRDQRKVLETWPADVPYDIAKASSKWDITLHFSFLLYLCGVFNVKNLKIKLQAIKKHRDCVSHGFSTLTQKELTEKIDELEKLYSFILNCVSDQSSENLDSVRNRIVSNLYNRLFVVNANGHAGLEDVWDFNASDTKRELKKLYTRKRSLIPAGIKECKEVPLTDLYHSRNLVITDGDSSFVDEDSEFVDGDSKFSRNFATLLQPNRLTVPVNKLLNYMTQNAFAEHLVITGRAGSGKSTLLLYILDQWCSGSTDIDGLDCVDLVLYVNLASIQSSTLVSLLQKELLKDACLNVHVNAVISWLQERNVLWLLDDFNETSAETRNLTEEIIQKFTLVITTSRREYLPTLRTYKDACTLIGQFEPLSFESSKDFARKIVSVIGNRDSFERFEKECLSNEVDSNGFKQCLLSSPSEITRLCFLWVKKHKIFTKIGTSSELYRELLSVRVETVVEQISKKVRGSKGDIMEKVLQWLIKLGEVIWQCRLHDVKFISEWNIKCLFSACERNGLAEVKTELMSAFLEMKEYNRRNILGSTTTYSIPDESLLGYLAAQHIYSIASDHPTMLLSHFIDNMKPYQPQNEKLCQILVNFIGILSMKHELDMPFVGDVVKVLFELGFEDWLTLLSEGKCNTNLSGHVAEILFLGCKIHNEDLTFRWNPLFSLLRQHKLAHVRVFFEQVPDDMEETIGLLRVICDYANFISVYCIWSVRDFGGSQFNDEILKAVCRNKSCRLLCFQGYLSGYALDKMIPPTIRHLHLRLTTLDQVIGLKQYLWDNNLLKIILMLDFPHTLYPGELYKLHRNNTRGGNPENAEGDSRKTANDNQESVEEDDLKTTNTKIITVYIPNIDDAHVFWAARVLQNISDYDYDRVYLLDSRVTDDGAKYLLDTIATLKIPVGVVYLVNDGKCSVLHPPTPRGETLLCKYISIIRRPNNLFGELRNFYTQYRDMFLMLNIAAVFILCLAYPDYTVFVLFNFFFFGPSLIGICVLLLIIALAKRNEREKKNNLPKKINTFPKKVNNLSKKINLSRKKI